MKIAIFGVGYVGITSAACLSDAGHQVIGIDVSQDKVDTINAGISPIAEPGVGDLIAAGVKKGTLRARRDIGSELDDTDIAIICVGTPSAVDGSHNMSFIAQVTRQIRQALDTGAPRSSRLTVLYRSTMRPGTIDQLIEPILRSDADDVEIVYNPEFLREATAIADYDAPPKIVIGTKDQRPCDNVTRLYAGIDAPRFIVGYREAEITKFVDNTFHALKVSFANEIGRVCAAQGVSASAVHEIFVADTKLNISPYYLRPGGAFGGSCLPKDVRALTFMSNETGAQTHVVDAIMRSNDAHKLFMFERATDGIEPPARILLNGLAFKANSDDLRESPNIDLARRLLSQGYDLRIWDPLVKPENLTGQNLGFGFAHLPALDQLLVRDRSALEALSIDRIVDCRGDAEALNLGDTPVIAMNAIS